VPLLRDLRRHLTRALGDEALGVLDYLRPARRQQLLTLPAWNGQAGRAALFASLLAAVRPDALLETGTYFGATTAALAATGLPVRSVELAARRFGFARARFALCRNVRLARGDSRGALAAWLGPGGPLRGRRVLAYLDAHWRPDLPLAAEVDALFDGAPEAVALIDDFAVPDDPGYAFDRYDGVALDAHYLAAVVARRDLSLFYPSLPSAAETGARRGAVVLAPPATAHLVQGVSALRGAGASSRAPSPGSITGASG